jgi:hypothetical protein
MAISVTDAFSNRDAHVQEAVRILGSSDHKWAIFEAVYRGKKQRKSVEEIASSTGLTPKQVLNVGGPIARGGLFLQDGRNPTFYVKISEITHIRDRIIAGKNATQRLAKTSPKSVSRRPSPASQSSNRAKQPVSSRVMHDVFISHASEDKTPFVRGLANEIRGAGISVWYDEFSLKWGDRLRASIDRGLRDCRFGIVVLSPDFFRKDWPQDELEGLFALEGNTEPKILPIWHNLDKHQVAQFSPMLAGRMAIPSNKPISEIIEKLRERLSN